MIRVVFRTDASLQIGSGHVMRCLTLADALRERGAQCGFVCRPHQGHLVDLISWRGHQALTLPVLHASVQAVNRNRNKTSYADWLGTDWLTDAEDTQQALRVQMYGAPVDWLVVDHYALDARWEQALRPLARRIMVIDDLAGRPHACDLLLDQNLGRNAKDYGCLLKRETITLIGPQYVLLRPEFEALRPQSLIRRSNTSRVNRLLITMGGVDKENATGQVLAALNVCALREDLHITIVMGPYAPWLAQVQTQAALMPCPTEVLVGVDNMAQLMADSDLAIGAAGGTAWERCCLGLPSIVLVLARNQFAGAIALQNAGAAVVLDSYQKIADFIGAMQTAEFAKEVLIELSNAAAAITDGQGCARTADFMMESIRA